MRSLILAVLGGVALACTGEIGSDGTGPTEAVVLARRYTISQQLHTATRSLLCGQHGVLTITPLTGTTFGGALTANGTCQVTRDRTLPDLPFNFDVAVVDGAVSGDSVTFFLSGNPGEPRCAYTGLVSGSTVRGELDCPAGSALSSALTGTWSADSIGP
jgi:hypothetical protein